MKKALVFVLAVALVMGVAIPVSAANTNTNSTEPFLVSSTSKDCVVYFANEMHTLSDVAQEVLRTVWRRRTISSFPRR